MSSFSEQASAAWNSAPCSRRPVGASTVTLIDKNEAFVFGFSKLDAEKEHFGSSRRARWFAG